MSALTCALLSVAAAAVIKIVLRFCVVSGVSQLGLLMLAQLGAFTITICCLDLPPAASLTAGTAVLLLANGALWFFAGINDIKSYQYLDAAVGELFGMFNFILITLAGSVLFHENITLMGAVGIALIIMSALYAGVGQSKSSIKGIRHKLVAILFVASGSVMNKYLCSFVDTRLIVLSGFLVPGLMYLAVGYREVPSLIGSIVKSRFRLLAIPVLGSISYSMMVQAYARGNLTTTVVVFQSCVVLVFILEVLLLKVRQDIVKRALACAACLAGVVVVCAG